MSFSISNVPKPCKDNSRYSSSSDRQQAPPFRNGWLYATIASGEELLIVKRRLKRNSPAPKFNVGSSQSSDQIHSGLHLRSSEGQGPAHISITYWPTLPSRSVLLPCQHSDGRYRNRSLETENRTSPSLRPILPPASKRI